MPSRDGTGPMGQGKLTGRGRGPCAGTAQAGFGFGGGYGSGCGFGGRGRGHRRFFRQTGIPGWARTDDGANAADHKTQDGESNADN